MCSSDRLLSWFRLKWDYDSSGPQKYQDKLRGLQIDEYSA
jgi:hypothetical protein